MPPMSPMSHMSLMNIDENFSKPKHPRVVLVPDGESLFEKKVFIIFDEFSIACTRYAGELEIAFNRVFQAALNEILLAGTVCLFHLVECSTGARYVARNEDVVEVRDLLSEPVDESALYAT